MALMITVPARAADRFVTVSPGVRIHVVDEGQSTREPALVLIPGWLMTTDVWRKQIALFSKERRVIAIDPRSQGLSTITAEGDTPEQRARDLHAVIQALNPGPIVLVAWSQGIQDAASYVDQFGTRTLKGVVFVDSTISGGSKAAATPSVTQFFDRLTLYNNDPTTYVQGLLHFIMIHPMPVAAFDRFTVNALNTPPAIGTAMLVADLYSRDRTAVLAKIDRPTLVIASAASFELDAQKQMAARIPHAQFMSVADAGHAVFVDQPERFDALLTKFLKELDA